MTKGRGRHHHIDIPEAEGTELDLGEIGERRIVLERNDPLRQPRQDSARITAGAADIQDRVGDIGASPSVVPLLVRFAAHR